MLHAVDVIGQLAGVVQIDHIVSPAEIAATVCYTGTFESRRWCPRRTPYQGATYLGHLHDVSFDCRWHRIGRDGVCVADMVAQQGQADANVGGKKHVRLRGRPVGDPGRGTAKTIYALMYVVPIHHASRRIKL